ncbi:MAG TPA: sulfite exporter TauE/SafE family protein [Gaiellaceae bacterium]
MQFLIVLLAVGFVAQLIDGALGMAYGATSTSLVLAAGLTPATASASVHMAELGTTLAAGFSHRRFGNVDWRTVKAVGFTGAAGAFLGAVVLSSISAEVATPWMAGVLMALGVYILARFTLGGPPRLRSTSGVRGGFLAPLGFGAGFVDATGGGGWGPAMTPTLLATGRMEPRKVVGSVDTSEFLVALAASIGFLLALGRQGVAWSFVGALLAGGIVAAPIAAWLVRKITAGLLGAAVGGMIIVTNVRTLFDALEVEGAVREPVYAAVLAVWLLAVAVVVRRHRQDGIALTNRAPRRPRRLVPASELVRSRR